MSDLRAAGVPPALLGLILGTSSITVGQWRNGYRRPSASARRLLWLVHRLWMGDAPRTLEDWFYWLPPKTPEQRAELDKTRGVDGDGI